MNLKTQFVFFLLLSIIIHFFFISTAAAFPNDDVEKHCSSFLSSASELRLDDETKTTLQADLSFKNGDWEQDNGGFPVMPFLDSHPTDFPYLLRTPLKLASFDAEVVGLPQSSRNSIRVTGHLSLGMSRKITFLDDFNSRLSVSNEPGSPVLGFSFHGIYTETAEERCLCLMGKSSKIFVKNISDFLQYDKVSLIIRCPRSFSLNKREIRGELKSLDEESGAKYFSTVNVTSQFARHSKYEFGSTIMKPTCNPVLYQSEMMEDGVQRLSNSEFCSVLDLVSQQVIEIFPNFKFGGSYLKGDELGTHLFGKGIEYVGIGSSYKNEKLVLQLIKCDHLAGDKTTDSAKVSAVLRAIPAKLDPSRAQKMTGLLSGLTLIAEGNWDPSTGQLCMIGCPQGIHSELQGCNLRISLYFARTFSVKQRSVIFGSISSVKDGMNSKFNLLFNLVWDSSFIRINYIPSYLSYNYSKISQASSFKTRTKPFQMFSSFKQRFLNYPSLNVEGEGALHQLDQLNVDGYLAPDQSPEGHKSGMSIIMDLVSLGLLLVGVEKDGPKQMMSDGQHYNFTSTDVLNVSSYLVFQPHSYSGTVISYKNLSELFLEGLYDPVVGEMHLIGCRKITIGSTTSERNLDCLIEVKIQYPFQNLQWLRIPVIKITITSQRIKQDPLYFGSVDIHAKVKTMRSVDSSLNTSADRIVYEEFIQCVIIAISVAIISTQLSYIKNKNDIIPSISIVMLGVQSIGYIIPLINGAVIPFKLEAYKLYIARYGDASYIMVSESFDTIARFQLLIAVIMNGRLVKSILDSRNNQGSQSKRMMFHSVCAIMYAFGCYLLLANYNQMDEDLTRAFVEMAQDFFLLPQILSNLFWHMNARSLRKTYYIGFTLIRLFVQFYNYIREPVLSFNFQEYKSIDLPDSSSELRKISVAAITVMLAVVLHIQQNLKNCKLKLRS